MENENVKEVKKKKKTGKASKVISFDEEVVPKHVAQEILARENVHIENKGRDNEEMIDADTKKKSKKRKKKNREVENIQENGADSLDNEVINMSEGGQVKRKTKKEKKSKVNNETEEELNSSKTDESSSKHTAPSNSDDINDDNPVKKIKKRKKRVEEFNENTNSEGTVEHKTKKKRKVQNPNESNLTTNDNEEGSKNESSEPKKTESIREQKRKKYAQLLKEKKLQTELALQQKSLNYLSKWKHSRSEWKFEKLRQIWLQQNMYDSSKVPQEFWETLVEYFSHSKGKAREIILKDAEKMIENENSEEEEIQTKIERARDIIQNLQE